MYGTVDSMNPMADIADPVTGVEGPFNVRFPHMRGATLAFYIDKIPITMLNDEESREEEATYNMKEDEAFLDDHQRRFWNRFKLAITKDEVARMEAHRAQELEDLEVQDELERWEQQKSQLKRGTVSVQAEHEAKRSRRAEEASAAKALATPPNISGIAMNSAENTRAQTNAEITRIIDYVNVDGFVFKSDKRGMMGEVNNNLPSQGWLGRESGVAWTPPTSRGASTSYC